ncbi:hypothetical protein CSPX01_16405 [Colletotrichum filicis]|nr:hypothetical protein CSPX01_16405 [Colletotrichum filicis]
MSRSGRSSNNGDTPPRRLSPGNMNGFSVLDAYWHMNQNAARNNAAFTGNANNGAGFSGPTYGGGPSINGGSTNIPFRPSPNGMNGINGNRQQNPLTPMRPAPRSPPFTHAGIGRGSPGPNMNGTGYGRGGPSNGGGLAFMSGTAGRGPRASDAYRNSPAAPFGVPGGYGRGGGGSPTQNGMINGYTNGYTNGYRSDDESSNGSPTRSPNGQGRGRGGGYGGGYGPYGPYGRGGGGVGGGRGGPSY